MKKESKRPAISRKRLMTLIQIEREAATVEENTKKATQAWEALHREQQLHINMLEDKISSFNEKLRHKLLRTYLSGFRDGHEASQENRVMNAADELKVESPKVEWKTQEDENVKTGEFQMKVLHTDKEFTESFL